VSKNYQNSVTVDKVIAEIVRLTLFGPPWIQRQRTIGLLSFTDADALRTVPLSIYCFRSRF